jgi:hypothetical protein
MGHKQDSQRYSSSQFLPGRENGVPHRACKICVLENTWGYYSFYYNFFTNLSDNPYFMKMNFT